MISWYAFYNDGSVISSNSSSNNSTDSIPRKGLKAFNLYNNNRPVLTIKPPVGSMFIFRRRVACKSGYEPEIVYIIGWDKGRDKSIMFYFTAIDYVVATDNWVNGDEWMYPIAYSRFDRQLVT